MPGTLISVISAATMLVFYLILKSKVCFTFSVKHQSKFRLCRPDLLQLLYSCNMKAAIDNILKDGMTVFQ